MHSLVNTLSAFNWEENPLRRCSSLRRKTTALVKPKLSKLKLPLHRSMFSRHWSLFCIIESKAFSVESHQFYFPRTNLRDEIQFSAEHHKLEIDRLPNDVQDVKGFKFTDDGNDKWKLIVEMAIHSHSTKVALDH